MNTSIYEYITIQGPDKNTSLAHPITRSILLIFDSKYRPGQNIMASKIDYFTAIAAV